MRIGLVLGYWGTVSDTGLALALEAEALGFDSVWVAEAYGTDAFTPLAWLGAQTERIRLGTALAQMPARTPATTAMTAATLDMLTGGRALLGLGTSGPQVVEGWHGVPFGRPLSRTREYVSIVRQAIRRDGPLEFHGEWYDVPYRGPGATGLGKALKLIDHPVRSDIPLYLGAMGPRNVELAAELADGWIPHLLSPIHFSEVYGESLARGFEKNAAHRGGQGFDIAAHVYVRTGQSLEECRSRLRTTLALIVGGYGALTKNFYADAVSRYGYESVARTVQELYLSGNRDAAARAVPDALVDELALVGPKTHIAKQFETWAASGVTTLLCWTDQAEALRLLADLAQ